MFDQLGLTRKKMASSFPGEWACKSIKQIQLEENGCVFRGQEALDNHELDRGKKCYCGRPNKDTPRA